MTAAVPQHPARPTAEGLELWAIDLTQGAGALIAIGREHGLIDGEPTADHGRLAARIALRLILAGYVGTEVLHQPFERSPSGKPSLAPAPDGCPPPLHFNLSHCETAGLVAISPDGPVGVDIEGERRPRVNDHRRDRLIEAARVLAPLDALPPEPEWASFLQAWVRLEAFAKGTGEGLGALLGRLATFGDRGADEGHDGLLVRDVALPGYRLWGAVAGPPAALSLPAQPVPVWVPPDGGDIAGFVTKTKAQRSSGPRGGA